MPELAKPPLVPSLRLYANTVRFHRLHLNGEGLAGLRKSGAKIDALSRSIRSKISHAAETDGEAVEELSAGLKAKGFGEHYSDAAKIDFWMAAVGIVSGIVDAVSGLAFFRFLAIAGVAAAIVSFFQDFGDFRKDLACRMRDAAKKAEEK